MKIHEFDSLKMTFQFESQEEIDALYTVLAHNRINEFLEKEGLNIEPLLVSLVTQRSENWYKILDRLVDEVMYPKHP